VETFCYGNLLPRLYLHSCFIMVTKRSYSFAECKPGSQSCNNN